MDLPFTDSNLSYDGESEPKVENNTFEQQHNYEAYFTPSKENSTHVPLCILSEDLSSTVKQVIRGGTTSRLRCVSLAASCNLLALGTNNGTVHLFQLTALPQDRRFLHSLTCVKEDSSISRLVTRLSFSPCGGYLAGALGSGIMLVWDLRSLVSSDLKPRCIRQNSLHSGVAGGITALSWAADSPLRLFVGDAIGRVTCIILGSSSSKAAEQFFKAASEVILEPNGSAVVQLDYSAGRILVSSRHRAILCDEVRRSYQQVGSKARDGPFGACFYGKNVICARPGARLWHASTEPSCEVHCTQEYRQLLAETLSVNLFDMDANYDCVKKEEMVGFSSQVDVQMKEFSELQLLDLSDAEVTEKGMFLAIGPIGSNHSCLTLAVLNLVQHCVEVRLQPLPDVTAVARCNAADGYLLYVLRSNGNVMRLRLASCLETVLLMLQSNRHLAACRLLALKSNELSSAGHWFLSRFTPSNIDSLLVHSAEDCKLRDVLLALLKSSEYRVLHKLCDESTSSFVRCKNGIYVQQQKSFTAHHGSPKNVETLSIDSQDFDIVNEAVEAQLSVLPEMIPVEINDTTESDTSELESFESSTNATTWARNVGAQLKRGVEKLEMKSRTRQIIQRIKDTAVLLEEHGDLLIEPIATSHGAEFVGGTSFGFSPVLTRRKAPAAPANNDVEVKPPEPQWTRLEASCLLLWERNKRVDFSSLKQTDPLFADLDEFSIVLAEQTLIWWRQLATHQIEKNHLSMTSKKESSIVEATVAVGMCDSWSQTSAADRWRQPLAVPDKFSAAFRHMCALCLFFGWWETAEVHSAEEKQLATATYIVDAVDERSGRCVSVQVGSALGLWWCWCEADPRLSSRAIRSSDAELCKRLDLLLHFNDLPKPLRKFAPDSAAALCRLYSACGLQVELLRQLLRSAPRKLFCWPRLWSRLDGLMLPPLSMDEKGSFCEWVDVRDSSLLATESGLREYLRLARLFAVRPDEVIRFCSESPRSVVPSEVMLMLQLYSAWDKLPDYMARLCNAALRDCAPVSAVTNSALQSLLHGQALLCAAYCAAKVPLLYVADASKFSCPTCHFPIVGRSDRLGDPSMELIKIGLGILVNESQHDDVADVLARLEQLFVETAFTTGLLFLAQVRSDWSTQLHLGLQLGLTEVLLDWLHEQLTQKNCDMAGLLVEFMFTRSTQSCDWHAGACSHCVDCGVLLFVDRQPLLTWDDVAMLCYAQLRHHVECEASAVLFVVEALCAVVSSTTSLSAFFTAALTAMREPSTSTSTWPHQTPVLCHTIAAEKALNRSGQTSQALQMRSREQLEDVRECARVDLDSELWGVTFSSEERCFLCDQFLSANLVALVTFPCSHFFHDACLSELGPSLDACPLC